MNSVRAVLALWPTAISPAFDLGATPNAVYAEAQADCVVELGG